MKRCTQLGNVVFDDPLWIDEEEKPNSKITETKVSASGVHIAYVQELKTPYITLVSKESGWITEAQAEEIKSMHDQIGTFFQIYYDNSTSEEVRFAHEKQLSITPLFEGACEYTVNLPLAKI